MVVRRVYFAFHYERDVWRANIVRNSWVPKEDREAAGFIDAADFEKAEKQGEEAVHRWVDSQLQGTSVTAVLIGAETSQRPYVKYEIEQSYLRGNGILGVHIFNLKDQDGRTDTQGQNPLDTLRLQNGTLLSQIYSTYFWFGDKGYDNFPEWVEKAAKQAGR